MLNRLKAWLYGPRVALRIVYQHLGPQEWLIRRAKVEADGALFVPYAFGYIRLLPGGTGEWEHARVEWNAIDEVRLWTSARTQAEVQANMCSALTGAEADLQGYWSFESSAADEGPNSLGGTIMGDASLVSY